MRVFALFLTVIFFSAIVFAQDNDETALYQVSDVEVDITAANAAQARDQAIVQAQRLAFSQLLARLGADPEIEKKASNDSIGHLVKALEVQQEKLSSTRYLGTFTIRFKPSAVRAFLNKEGIKYSEVSGNPVTVLPITRSGSRYVMWEDRTEWRAVWEKVSGKGGVVPIIVPEGGLEDIAVIGTEEAVSGKAEALTAMMEKYKTDALVVALLDNDLANLSPNQDIKIGIKKYDRKGNLESEEHISLPPILDAKNLEKTLYEGVKQIRNSLERKLRESEKTPKGQLAYLRVMVPINSLADWNEKKETLAKAEGIKKINVISLAKDFANIELEFYGEISRLQASVLEQGLELTQNSDTGAWLIKRKNITIENSN